MKKSDEQLLAEAIQLDNDYTRAEWFHLRKENEYLRQVLGNLVDSIREHIQGNGTFVEEVTEGLDIAVMDAEEALGWVE